MKLHHNRESKGAHGCPLQSGSMRLALYVSRWSAQAPAVRTLGGFLDAVAAHGLQGVEMSLGDLGESAAQRQQAAAAIEDRGLRLICGVYSGWQVSACDVACRVCVCGPAPRNEASRDTR